MLLQGDYFKWRKQLMVMLIFVLVFGSFSTTFVPKVSAASSPLTPGGLSGSQPVLWLKADSDVNENNGLLTEWADQSTDPVRFTLDVPTGKEAITPKYNSVGVNFNPSITFNNSYTTDHYDQSAKLIGDKQITFQSGYAVYKWPATGYAGSLVGSIEIKTYGSQILGGNADFAVGNGASKVWRGFKEPDPDRERFQLANYEIKDDTNHSARVNGKAAETIINGKATFGTFEFTPVIGATAGTSGSNWRGLRAEVAEIILYDSLTSDDAAKIETYLGVKYGITLNNGESNYISTNDDTVWTADSTYKHNIAGIGQDDAEALVQKQSRSINAGTQIAIGVNTLVNSNALNTGTLSDQQYLIWGDNGQDLTFDQQIGSTNEYHSQRVWKVQNTNGVGEVQIAIPTSAIPAGKKLLVSSSDTDFTNATQKELEIIDLNGVEHYAAKTTLNNGQFFTFGVLAQSAKVEEITAAGDEVVLTFDQEIVLTDLTGFTLEINGVEVTIDSFEIGVDGKTLKLKTSEEITQVDAVKVSYEKSVGNLKGKNGAPVHSFDYLIAPPALVITEPSGDTVFVKKPEIKGTTTPGAKVSVEIKDGSGAVIATPTVTVNQDGTWSFIPSADLVDGSYTIEVTSTKDDKTAKENKIITVDTTNPALVITEPSGDTLFMKKPEIKGTADKDAKVIVELKDESGNVVETREVEVDSNGNWSFIPSTDLKDGKYTINVTAEKHSKVSTDSKIVTVDTTDKSQLSGLELKRGDGTPIAISPAFNGGVTHYQASVTHDVYNTTVTLATYDPNATIEISVNGGVWKAIPNGSVSDELPLAVGTNTIVVKVTDAQGNVTEYTLTITRGSNGSNNNGGNNGGNSGGNTTPATPPTTTPPATDPGVNTSVNGNDGGFATGKTTTSGGNKQTSVLVNRDKLGDILSNGTGQKLAIQSSNDGDMQVDGLTAETVKQLADKGASLEIGNLLAIYPVPGGKMDLSGVSKQLGNAALGDIAVHIDIQRSSKALTDSARSKAKAEGYELLVDPVDLDMTFTHDGQTVRSGQLSGYAPKYIALPEGIDPNRITTGVIVNPDGTVFHVPTVVTKINSRYYALINDLRSHGSYSVIWNPQDFDDVKKHWGKVDVNNIAARLDLEGTGNNTFSPDRNVTRSEFSEIVVAGLGLMRQNVPNSIFPDVPESAWYQDAVTIANEFGIVRGYDNGNFYGDQQITREQGMAMIARAYSLIDPKTELSEEQITSLLAGYKDAASVSGWAREDVALLVEVGIVKGSGMELLSPKSNMTRAEVTALIARLLKTTNLIDK
ncbi:S-layer homology domain-containing protein [Paenibacillus lutimineralis]|uniref:SLH domain-containing protein n=1 Tax=Paenibacillus lutimineralis TaxID=2707005 RepID=A0A3Q9I9Q5_9BACL|nr:S-layer homology domain-containing protein [Paenibacillus lutimineralis]AZS14312.1 hypothetical protein EI981_07470 [Paenibacillus lutimineralis]